MSSVTLMKLGDFVFSMDTANPDSYSNNVGWNWQEQSLIDEHPQLQFTTYQAQTKSISGKIYPNFKGSLWQIEQLVAYADQAEPMTLIDGSGRVLGDWVITGINYSEDSLDRDGNGRRIAFQIDLKKYA